MNFQKFIERLLVVGQTKFLRLTLPKFSLQGQVAEVLEQHAEGVGFRVEVVPVAGGGPHRDLVGELLVALASVLLGRSTFSEVFSLAPFLASAPLAFRWGGK